MAEGEAGAGGGRVAGKRGWMPVLGRRGRLLLGF